MQIARPHPSKTAPGNPGTSGTSARASLPGWIEPVRRYGEYVLGGATLVGVLLTIWAALIYAPTDVLTNDNQRIFYVHVPMAWLAYLAFFIVFIASIMYLWRKDERWDLLARASAEVGVVFTTLVLITGSLWGRPIWGTWWVWDARLTTTLILWFVYVGYLLLRSYTGRTASGARAAAVLGILGLLDVPIVHMSVTWWNTLHPQPVVLTGTGKANLPAEMVTALMIAMVTFTLLFAFLVLQAYRLQSLQSAAQRLRARVELDAND